MGSSLSQLGEAGEGVYLLDAPVDGGRLRLGGQGAR